MTKWMVNIRFRRTTHTPLPDEVAEIPFAGGDADDGAGKALARMLAFTWEFVHAFDNRPAGKDTVSFHFVHRKQVGEQRSALIAHGGRIEFLSAEGALALNPEAGYEFSKPEEHPMPPPAPKAPVAAKAAPVVQVRPAHAAAPRHQDRPTHRAPSQNGQGHRPPSRRDLRNRSAQNRIQSRDGGRGGFKPLSDAELAARYAQGPAGLEAAFAPKQ